MRIAVLGWGSLVWNPGTLSLASPEWHEDGPLLPIEFARISGRKAGSSEYLSLVLHDGAKSVRTLWALAESEKLPAAIANLASREGSSIEDIGYMAPSHQPPSRLTAASVHSDELLALIDTWRGLHGFDAVIWTDLGSNFGHLRGADFTPQAAISYLQELVAGGTAGTAENYIRRAPQQVGTPVRDLAEQLLGWMPIDHWNPLVAEYIGPHYVYLLIDPKSDEIFYVGKGKGRRFHDHFPLKAIGDDVLEEEVGTKTTRIRAIQAAGRAPVVRFARIKIPSEKEALLVEAALIDVLHRYGKGRLTNAIRGHGSDSGLISYEDLQQLLTTPALDTATSALLIKLNWWTPDNDTELPRQGYGYKQGMSGQELYDSTRAWWRISVDRAKRFPYAVAVYQGITRGVWEVDHSRWRAWQSSAHSTEPRRVAFEGRRLLDGPVFEAFYGERGKRVTVRPGGGPVFGTGNPIAYWPE